jgi:hypothetical protein
MNDKIEVVMRLVAADWPNCSKSEILEHLPDMAEVADAILAAAGEQDGAMPWRDVAADFDAKLSAAQAEIARLKRLLEPLTEKESHAEEFNYSTILGTEWEQRRDYMMRIDRTITTVKNRRA